MKNLLMFSAMALALLAGCSTDQIPMIVGPQPESALELKTLEFSGTVGFYGKAGELQYTDVQGRVRYNMDLQLARSASKIINLEISTDVMVGSTSLAGNSSYAIALNENGEASLVTVYSFSRSGILYSLNVEFTVGEESLSFSTMWISGGNSIE